jgi:hypothetical protein
MSLPVADCAAAAWGPGKYAAAIVIAPTRNAVRREISMTTGSFHGGMYTRQQSGI